MYKPEEGSAGEAGHGTVVDVLGRWLVAHLHGGFNLNLLFHISSEIMT